MSIQRPALGVPSLSATGDGVAYVSRLVHRALVDTVGEIAVLQMHPRSSGHDLSRGDAVRFAERIVRTQLVSRPDWWLFTHLGPAGITRRLPAPVRRPYAVYLHGQEVWRPDLPDERKLVLRDAKLRIANSTYTARRAEHTHDDVGAIIACPLGLLPDEPRVAKRGALEASDSADIDTLIARMSSHTALIVGHMADSERYKGHDVLIDSWTSVRKSVPDAQLIVVGEGDDVARLRSRAESLGVGDAVIFTGFLSDAALRQLRRRVSLFAMPSTGEGFGLVYLEAMRDRLPCIASNIDAAGDIIVNGETGYLVDPMDPGEIASAVIPLLQDGALRNAMGEAGYRRYEAQFSFERFKARFLKIVEDHFPGDPR